MLSKLFIIETLIILISTLDGYNYLDDISHFINFDNVNNLIGNVESKEYFLITNKRKEKYKLLRPELTYLAYKTVSEKQNNRYSYCQYCFRNERKQFGRLKEFKQFGLEFIHINKNKIRINTYLILSFIRKLIDIFNLTNLTFYFECAEESKNEIESFLNLIFSKDLKIVYKDISRLGNVVTTYSDFTFELYCTVNDSKLELLGGGEYLITDKENRNLNKINGTGFALGVKRLLLKLTDSKFNYDLLISKLPYYFSLLDSKEEFVLHLSENISLDKFEELMKIAKIIGKKRITYR